MRLEVRAAFRAKFGRFAPRLLAPGERVCSICAEGLTLFPSDPAELARMVGDRGLEAALRCAALLEVPAGERAQLAASELREGPRSGVRYIDRRAAGGAA